MKKKHLIGICITFPLLIVLASMTPVAGVQTVVLSNNKKVQEYNEQKEILFQIILDIANNKEIQQQFQRSQNGGRIPVLTREFLDHAYTMGVYILSFQKFSIKAAFLERIRTTIPVPDEQFVTMVKQQLKEKLTGQDCGCEEKTTPWNFPVLCILLIPLLAVSFGLYLALDISIFFAIIWAIGKGLNCVWYIPP